MLVANIIGEICAEICAMPGKLKFAVFILQLFLFVCCFLRGGVGGGIIHIQI